MRRIDDDASVGVDSLDDALKVSQIALDDDYLVARHELQISLASTDGFGQRGQRAAGVTALLTVLVVTDGELLKFIQRRRIGELDCG